MRFFGHGLIMTLGCVGGAALAATAPAASALAGGQMCAGVVVDDGTGTAPTPQGANVSPGSSDLDLLSAAGDTVTQNNAGLVCAINDYPADALQNCLSASHGLFYYWSYWEGDPVTNVWTYASVGPAEHTMSAGQAYVEGWRYQDPGPDSPAATKPSVTPAVAFARACQSSTPVTTTTPGSAGGSSVTTTVPGTSPAATPVVPPAPAASSSDRGRSGDATPTTPSSSPQTGGGSNQHAAGDTHSPPTSTPTSTPPGASPRTSAQLALAHQAGSRGSGGDPVLPILIVLVLLALLGGEAWRRWRRPVEE